MHQHPFIVLGNLCNAIFKSLYHRKVFTGNKPFCAAVKEAVGKRVVAMNFGVLPNDDRDPVFRSDRLKFHVVDCMGLLHDTLIHLPPMHAHTMLAQQLGVAAADTGGEVPSLYGFGTCVCVSMPRQFVVGATVLLTDALSLSFAVLREHL